MYMYSYNLYVRVSSQFLFIYIKFIQINTVSTGIFKLYCTSTNNDLFRSF